MLANIKLIIEQAYDLDEMLGLFESCLVGCVRSSTLLR